MGSVSKYIKRRYIIPLLLILSIVLLPCTFTIVDGRIVYRFTKTYSSLDDIDTNDNDLRNLSKLKNVEELRFSSAEMTNIDFVLEMKKLRSISVSSYKITDYSPLGECKNLEAVLIHATPIDNLESLTCIEQLQLLCIDQCNNVEDIDDLKNLKHLKTLRISSEKIHDISSISELKELTTLELSNTAITDISPLYECNELTSLDLWGNRSLTDINGIEKLDKLEDIDLIETSIEDFEPLLEIKNLKKVTVSKYQLNNKIREALEEKGVNIVYIG